MNYNLIVTNIHDRLKSIWQDIEISFLLREINEGKIFQAEKLARLRDKTLTEVSEITRDLWLNEYGLVNRQVNRAKHKRFNPDGTWTSNGVRFGP